MMLSASRQTFLILALSFTFSLPKNISAECIDGNCVNGQGTYLWPTGDKYTGEWKDGKRHGKGSFIWPDGDRFVGEWKNDTNNGQGTYIYPASAKLYLADFDNKDPNGYGCLVGDCVNGYGIYTWLSGATYDGDFKNGQSDGLGIYTFPNGLQILGLWTNGKYIGKKKPQLSKWDG